MTSPLTATRPAAIHSSALRREASPARAITLAMRSPGLCWSSGVMPSHIVMPGLVPGIHVFIPPTDVDGRDIGERGDAILRTAMPGHDGDMTSFMDMALEEARAAGARGEVPVGCRHRARRRGARARRQPHARRPRPDRACRDDRHPPSGIRARLRTPRRLRSLCHARALRHVRRRGRLRAHPQALLRRRRPEGRRGGQRREVFRVPHLPSPARSLWRAGGGGSSSLLKEFFKERR